MRGRRQLHGEEADGRVAGWHLADFGEAASGGVHAEDGEGKGLLQPQ